MSIRIVPLQLRDYEGMIDIWRRAGLIGRVERRDDRRSFARQLRSNKGLYFGAYDGDRLVGTVLGTHDTRKGWINRLAVEPSYQSRGIGTRLLRACERALARKGMRVFSALVENGNERSKNVFRKSGYEIAKGILYVRKKVDPDA